MSEQSLHFWFRIKEVLRRPAYMDSREADGRRRRWEGSVEKFRNL